jgi:hypothetical protein
MKGRGMAPEELETGRLRAYAEEVIGQQKHIKRIEERLRAFEEAARELLLPIPSGAAISTETVPYLAVIKLRALLEPPRPADGDHGLA